MGYSRFRPTWLACLNMSEIILKGMLNLIKKEKESNKQELEQSEDKSHSQNHNGK